MTLNELLAEMDGAALVIDPVTDEHETAKSCEVKPLALVDSQDLMSGGAALALRTVHVTDQALIRALYDHPSATAYGDGSYTVTIR